MQIMIMDQGIIQFNAKPKDGIAYLIKNKVITEDALDIAKFLATTDKLDKHVLGNFLGKDNEFSVAILNKFASLFHYEGVPFDQALRSFTNRFAMPGESQMIYRILERFSVYYSQSNPALDKDMALILAYALIMLNVDLHSSRVKAKMTKEEFVRNTDLALSGCVARSDLGDMYSRILAKEFKPDTSAEEIVYSKLAVNPKYSSKSSKGPAASSDPTLDNQSRMEILKRGAVFLKYGREGSPHPRKVFLSPDGKKLCWIDPKKLAQLEKKAATSSQKTPTTKSTTMIAKCCDRNDSGDVPESPVPDSPPESSPPDSPEPPALLPDQSAPTHFDRKGQPHHGPSAPPPISLVLHGNDLDIVRSTFVKLRARGPTSPDSFKRSIPLEDITGLVVGTGGTRNLRKFFSTVNADDPELEQRCFSIITDYRTLDLQAPPSVDITPWLHFLHSVLSDREKRLRAAADKNKDIWSFTQKERASLVRWQEIVPLWAEHWNCGARVTAGGGYRASQHPKEELLNHRMFLVNPTGFVLDRGQRLETAVSPHLVALWLEGIPSSVRPRIWPIAAGNNLRISESFFQQLLVIVQNEREKANVPVDANASNINMSMIESVGSQQEIVGGSANGPVSSVLIPSVTQMLSGENVAVTSPIQGGVLTAEKELERELKSSSIRKFANRALAWIDARGSREQQAFFKPMVWDSSLDLVAGTAPPQKPRKSMLWNASVTAGVAGASPASDSVPAVEASAVASSIGGFVSNHRENVESFDEQSAREYGGTEDVENSETKSENSWDSTDSPMTNGWENVCKATRIIVSAFLTQRRDIKYTRGMAQLAAMVVLNVGIQDLSRAFSVYSNILHQFYFLEYFTLQWRDMKMRSDLYGKLLRERMPYLDDHFNAIQITSDLYFNQWMLTGFTRVLPFRTACRVWDGFLLLGESYLFTAALALLNYYEHSLMTSGFSGCLEILLGHADEVLFNDKKFFECVHYQSVSNERFAAWISAQRLAEEKTALYDLLLLM